MDHLRDGGAGPEDGEEQALVSFCRKLDEFAAELSERERLALGGLIFRAMSPLDRFRWANSSDVLTEEEKRVLRSLSDVGER